jgi:hypothetical protein
MGDGSVTARHLLGLNGSEWSFKAQARIVVLVLPSRPLIIAEENSGRALVQSTNEELNSLSRLPVGAISAGEKDGFRTEATTQLKNLA